MRRIVFSKTGAGTSNWIPLDTKSDPFHVGLFVVVSGTVNYTIEYTGDDVQDANVTPTAFPHAVIASKTANSSGNLAFPVSAIRINNASGSGTTVCTVIQAGRGG